MFAVPHAVTVTGGPASRSATGDLVADGRNNVINSIKAQPGWASTVYTRSDGTVLRVLAPGKAAERRAAEHQLPRLVHQLGLERVHQPRRSPSCRSATSPTRKYFGRTTGTVMNFTNASGAAGRVVQQAQHRQRVGLRRRARRARTTRSSGPISRTLCAALNRGTLGTIDTQPSANAADFYKNNPTNQYAQDHPREHGRRQGVRVRLRRRQQLRVPGQRRRPALGRHHPDARSAVAATTPPPGRAGQSR